MELAPCFYEFIWRQDELILRIHKKAVTQNIPADAPIVKDYKKKFGFRKFAGVFGENIGFEEVLKFVRERDGFLEYFVPISVCRKPTGRKCTGCDGSGKDENMGRVCLYCGGAKIEYRFDYKEAFAVSASISLLLFLLNDPEIKTDCPSPQLMTLNTITIEGPHGGSLSGDFSAEFVNFIRSLSISGRTTEVVNVMKSVSARMEARNVSTFQQHKFRISIQGDARLCVDCPGDACGLHPSGHSVEGKEGYQFSSHNVDQPMQQMILISALAKLNTIARDWLNISN